MTSRSSRVAFRLFLFIELFNFFCKSLEFYHQRQYVGARIENDELAGVTKKLPMSLQLWLNAMQ